LHALSGGRQLFGSGVFCGLLCAVLCALSLVIDPGTRREIAHAAKSISGYVARPVYFSRDETQDIAQGGGLAGSICGIAAPGWYKVLCLAGPIWAWEANQALDQGKCLATKPMLYNSPTYYWLIRYRGTSCW
jgi:hypothetical protein